MYEYLIQDFNFAREDVILLTEDQVAPYSQPTRCNIILAMHWQVKEAQFEDQLYFHYSGHGWEEECLEGECPEEAIYPVDFHSSGRITGHELHQIMVNKLAPGVRLAVVLDTYCNATMSGASS